MEQLREHGLAEALYWLRTQTSVDALVILPIDVVKHTHMIHERQTYVRKTQKYYTEHIPAYEKRVDHLERLYAKNSGHVDDEDLLEEMASELPGRALYAVVHDDEVSADAMAERGATQVINSPAGGAHVYLLNPSSGI